jgi:putative transposase
MEHRQAFKFTLMPNGEQAQMIRRFAGSARYVYNHALALNDEMYAVSGKRHTRFQSDKLLPHWKAETPWLTDAPAHSLQQAIVDLERAYTRFFADVKKGYRIAPSDKKLRRALRLQRIPMAYPPTFHKKGERDSFRESDPKCIALDQANNRIKLPKIGWVRYRNSREVLGAVCNVTVSIAGGKYFVSINTLREVEQPIHPSDSAVGVDFGVVQFASMSDGTHSVLPSTAAFEARKKFLQRQLRHKTKFSNNWKKLQAKIAKVVQRITNIRNNHRHQFTNTLTKNHGVVFSGDLSVCNMSASAAGTVANPGKNVKQKSGLNREILAQGWGEVDRQLAYKMQWRGGLHVLVPERNTSRTCLSCGHVSAENRKTQAEFVCVECGFEAQADFVGAVNIREAGLALLACSQPSRDVSASCQEPTEATQVQKCA